MPEEVVEREVVDELGRLVGVELAQVAEDVLLHVPNHLPVVPHLVEPLLEFAPVPPAVDDEIELDVVVALAQPEPADGEVRAADDGILKPGCLDVVELAVE